MTTSQTISNLGQHLKQFLLPASQERFFLHWFLLIAIPLCFILPPFMGPDEASHVYRTYEFSRGDLLLNKYSDGYGFPIAGSLVQLNSDQFWSNSYQPFHTALKHNLAAPSIHKSGTVVQYFEGTIPYTPLSYIHFIIVMLFSRLAHLPAYPTIQLLRLSNIAAYAALAFFAIKFTPKRKWFMVMVALLPMAIHQASVVSPDGLVNGAALLSVGLIAALLTSREYVGNKLLTLLFASLVLVAFAKQAYILLPLILLVVPLQNFKAPLSKVRYISAIFAVSLIILGAWMVISGPGQSAAWATWRQRENYGQTETTGEFIHNLVAHPINSAEFLAHSLIYNIAPRDFAANVHPEFYAHNLYSNFTYMSFLGSFGSLMVDYPFWLYFIVVAGLVMPLLAETGTYLNSVRLHLFVLALIVAESLVLAFGFWLKWTARTDPAIVGVQGRYFIPLLGLLVFIPTGKNMALRIRDGLLPKLLMACVAIEGFGMLWMVFARFYTGI